MSGRPRPCPRCGSGSVKIVARRGAHYGHCLACMFSGQDRPSSAEALEAWNAASSNARASSGAARGRS